VLLSAGMSQISKCLNLAIGFAAACFLASCAQQSQTSRNAAAKASVRRIEHVRTTAYTHTERGGHHNALDKRLAGHDLMSAASDWSRFPLGTRFRITGTKDEYIIDDYGTALIGTNTIDLYKPSRLEMKRWGVRHVDIDILQWGSEEESLKVLGPRKKHHCVRQMVVALQKKKSGTVATR
jgi:3D (Asp-Asp-Asp) domain-containing protein